MMVRFDLSTSMDTGHDGDDPAHPLERYGEAGREGEGEMAIYSRYSSDLQNDRSIEDREKYAKKNGCLVKGNFYDRAASGASLFGRPCINVSGL